MLELVGTETRKTFLHLPSAIEAEEAEETYHATLKIRQHPFGTRVAEQF